MSARAEKSAGRSGSLHVLVVDDSAVVRTAMTAILSREPGVKVSVASDPLIAMGKIQSSRPDVIVLDLEMPKMDGLTFLQRLMAEDPIPVVVCSGLAGPSTEAALRSVELGAVDVVQKPQVGVRDFLEDASVLLVDAIRGAAQARTRARAWGRAPRVARASRASASSLGRSSVVSSLGSSLLRRTTDKVVAIGASTGGTEALRQILMAMPPDGPGMVIVQHMPEVFTAAFASRLNEDCQMEVKEAEDGDRVMEGRALIAPGNKHTRVVRNGAHYAVSVGFGELVSRHRPSVDVLFKSVAKAAGANAVGVIMTGMGDDGADGLLEMRRAGAVTLAQDESSCVVFGMPKEAIERGGVMEVVSLEQLGGVILRRVQRQQSNERGA